MFYFIISSCLHEFELKTNLSKSIQSDLLMDWYCSSDGFLEPINLTHSNENFEIRCDLQPTTTTTPPPTTCTTPSTTTISTTTISATTSTTTTTPISLTTISIITTSKPITKKPVCPPPPVSIK